MKKILLTQGKFALVDDEDYEMLSKYKWCCTTAGYAMSYIKGSYKKGKSKYIYMHRLITNPPKEKCLDHINGNTLDNRKSNLRVCTQSQNTKNKTKKVGFKNKYKGVSFFKSRNKWRARIKVNYKEIHLGLFLTELLAVEAYNQAAIKYHGEFCNLNIIKNK